MVEKRVSVRLGAVGGDQLKAELRTVGREGREALRSIDSSAAPATSGLNNVGGAAGGTVVALENLSSRAQRVARSLRAAGASTGALVDRVNQVTGVSARMGRSADDIAAYGRALDDTRAKFNPMFAVVRQYRGQLEQIRQAHRVGAISSDEMTAAIQRERQAALGSIAALKGRTTVINGMSRATQYSTTRMAGLYYQVNDIGVSLASGQNPFTVMLQQGTQISQLYGFGGGGVNGLMRDLGRMILGPIKRFPLVTAAVVATGVALAGMTHEINEATGASVTMGDTASAAVSVITGAIGDQLRPVVEAIAPWFATTWDRVVIVTKDLGNSVISIFVGTYNFITSLFSGLPGFISGLAKEAVNGVMDDLRKPWLEVNGRTIVPGLPIPEDAGFELSPEESAAVGSFGDALNRDYMGEFFNAVKVEAVNNALERTSEAAEKAGAAGRNAGEALSDTAEAAESGWGKTLKTIEDYASGAMDLAGGIGDAIVGAFRGAEDAVVDFVKTGKLNFSDMVTSLIADLARLATRRFILGPIANALGGVLGGPGPTDFFSGLVSNEGGGHTGHGARTGGLDGRGGYLAMVHPQERIVDEYQNRNRGRASEGMPPVVVNIQTRDAESFRRSRTQVAADIQRAVAVGQRGM